MYRKVIHCSNKIHKKRGSAGTCKLFCDARMFIFRNNLYLNKVKPDCYVSRLAGSKGDGTRILSLPSSDHCSTKKIPFSAPRCPLLWTPFSEPILITLGAVLTQTVWLGATNIV